jgi:uncharacterized protein involved in outer membrane biogenesis
MGSTTRYSIMKKLIIAIGIIAAILAVIISFKTKNQLRVIGQTLDLQTIVSIKFSEVNQINWRN